MKCSRFAIVLLAALLMACSSYYQSNQSFNRAFQSGQLTDALASVQSGAYKKNSNQFLYQVNSALILSMLGKYDKSNELFEQAFIYGEDYRANYLYEAASYLTNPTFTSYKGEDHEHLMVLYYKALNYLKEKKTEEALVECRRLNIRLQQLSDRYTSSQHFRRDAMIHTVMGLIYESDRDYNNAYIAYKNAYEAYRDDYGRLFNVEVPQQLKIDLMRTAYLTGFGEDFQKWKNEFDMKNFKVNEPDGEAVLLWHTGLAPVKIEWGVTMAISVSGNNVMFSNQEFKQQFPFQDDQKDELEALKKMQVLRVAFPKYAERPVFYETATASANGKDFPLQKMEDVNAVAMLCLKERMCFEFGKALLRMAVKKTLEFQVRKENQLAGSALGILNALTEHADTRSWQTLPHTICYARIPLHIGENDIVLHMKGNNGEASHSFKYNVKKGDILFHTFSSLESLY